MTLTRAKAREMPMATSLAVAAASLKQMHQMHQRPYGTFPRDAYCLDQKR